MAIRRPHKYAPRKPRKERSTTATIAILSVLALATVGLSGAALFSQDDGDTPSGGDARVTTESTQDAGNESTSLDDATPSDDSAETQLGSAVRSDRLLAVSDDPERLLRAHGTECGAGESRLEVSDDGGQSWTQADTSMLEMAGVQQLEFGETGSAQLAFVDQQCTLQFARSYVYGGEWEAGSGAGGIWILAPDRDSQSLIVSGTAVEAPCAAVGVSGTENSGIILCDDMTVSVSDDRGQSWSDPVSVPGAQAVASDSDDFLVVSQDTQGCSGVSARSFDGEELSEPGDCIESEAEPDQVASAVGGGSLFVWANEDVLRSDDLGASWN